MPESVSKLLEQYVSKLNIFNIKPDKQYLFVNPKTQKIYDHNALYRRLKKMVKGIDIEHLTFHDLRHLQATMLINSRVNIVVVAKGLAIQSKPYQTPIYIPLRK